MAIVFCSSSTFSLTFLVTSSIDAVLFFFFFFFFLFTFFYHSYGHSFVHFAYSHQLWDIYPLDVSIYCIPRTWHIPRTCVLLPCIYGTKHLSDSDDGCDQIRGNYYISIGILPWDLSGAYYLSRDPLPHV